MKIQSDFSVYKQWIIINIGEVAVIALNMFQKLCDYAKNIKIILIFKQR